MAGLTHPELDRGDGACINLTEDNLCSIYEDRPDFCRLNPERPVEEQTKWCKLMEANWPRYAKTLEQTFRDLTGASGCGILPGNEIDGGQPKSGSFITSSEGRNP